MNNALFNLTLVAIKSTSVTKPEIENKHTFCGSAVFVCGMPNTVGVLSSNDFHIMRAKYGRARLRSSRDRLGCLSAVHRTNKQSPMLDN